MNRGDTEAAQRADFSRIRYAQVWEDADILLEALNIQEGARCLSITSAGDNVLAMLTRKPELVYAIDLNPAQIYCLQLRIAAFRCLEYEEVLELIGSRASERRVDLFEKCRQTLPDDADAFWDRQRFWIERGIGHAGKFERYFELFRKRLMPWIHGHSKVVTLLTSKPFEERRHFYEKQWDTVRWRLLFRVFFSRFLMGKLGRDPAFFKYVEGSVADRFLERTRYALTELDPAQNPYLQWILYGRHVSALPLYLRREHYETIRSHLDRIKIKLCTVEAFSENRSYQGVDAVNLSDIFEYMSEESSLYILEHLHAISNPGARFAYWNMLVPRSSKGHLGQRLRSLDSLADALFKKDKAFFYSRFIIEEVMHG